MRLTAATLRSLACPEGKSEQTFFDEDLPGFGLRTRPSGAQSWLYQYAIAGRTRKIFLGSPTVVDPGKARQAAKDLAAAIRLGRDPASEKATSRIRAVETVAAFLPRFLARQRERLKPRSYIETERHLLVHAKPLHGLALERVDRRTVATRLMEIAEKSGGAAANRVRASLSGFFSWAAREGLVESNPVSYTNKSPEAGGRDRVLNDAELRAIWLALKDDDYGVIVKLLALIGCRREEIGSLRWSEVNFEAATIALPPARTKNRREHVIPLSPSALAILQAQRRRREAAGAGVDLVFGRTGRGFKSWAVSKLALDARLAAGGEALAPWVLHDFRRSVSTVLHERFNVPPHIVEVVLGHVGGHQAGIAGTYNKALYLDERRRALERWGAHIVSLVSGEPAEAKIVSLR
jgi:integrase